MPSKRYRKLPVVIDALRFDGENVDDVVDFCGSLRHDGTNITISTLEGLMTVSPGDWIIRGVAGEYYPCKPDIFSATYEEDKR